MYEESNFFSNTAMVSGELVSISHCNSKPVFEVTLQVGSETGRSTRVNALVPMTGVPSFRLGDHVRVIGRLTLGNRIDTTHIELISIYERQSNRVSLIGDVFCVGSEVFGKGYQAFDVNVNGTLIRCVAKSNDIANCHGKKVLIDGALLAGKTASFVSARKLKVFS